jgi:hypothetical protein
LNGKQVIVNSKCCTGGLGLLGECGRVCGLDLVVSSSSSFSQGGLMNLTEYHRCVLRASEEWTGHRVWVHFLQCYACVDEITSQGLAKIVFDLPGSDEVQVIYVDLDSLDKQVVLA